MSPARRAPGTRDIEAGRRKKRQGSETRSMSRTLQVRYNPTKLRHLEAAAGPSLPSLIRLYGDFLTELLPVTEQQAPDPVELIREATTSLLDPATVRAIEAVRATNSQASVTGSMSCTLQVRYNPTKLRQLEEAAGRGLSALMRGYGDFLTELLAVAEQLGLDPVELIREATTSLLGARELLSA
ncbi:hypothetical protein [Mycobacterium attenuatum]|uniref:hypothetical protein n=1 Tax=Mycobacterium attenuatum TaxID=2341086 RepID=UPI000F137D9D|nr:hypothetical protein [Mycobacterium attenuatum]VBA61490.1 hypothetical protein LAUMK41_04866 [Mycobacterium attenuatum]